jgi:hypothetical protein
MKCDHEEEIVWLDDRSKYPYLREVQLPISGRTRKPRSSIVAGRLIAYATLKPTAPAHSPGMFARRLFYVTQRDPYERGGPYEAVDPYSVQPGIPAMRGEEIIPEWVAWQRAARVL